MDTSYIQQKFGGEVGAFANRTLFNPTKNYRFNC